MALLEDATIFLQDFGVPVNSGLVTGLGILDMPGEVIMNDMVISTDYTLRCETSKFGSLAYGSPLIVNGETYSVREVRRVDDGTFCEVSLQRETDPDAELVIDGDWDDLADVTTPQGEVVINGDWE
jgi:hypothetical protein